MNGSNDEPRRSAPHQTKRRPISNRTKPNDKPSQPYPNQMTIHSNPSQTISEIGVNIYGRH